MIASEEAIAKGIRRIVVVTGEEAEKVCCKAYFLKSLENWYHLLTRYTLAVATILTVMYGASFVFGMLVDNGANCELSGLNLVDHSCALLPV